MIVWSLDMAAAPRDGSWILLDGGSLSEQRDWQDGYERRPVVAKWVERGDAHPWDGWVVADFDNGCGQGIWYDEPCAWAPIAPPVRTTLSKSAGFPMDHIRQTDERGR